MASGFETRGTGWHPDYPSFTDLTPQRREILDLMESLGLEDLLTAKSLKKPVPSKCDFRKWSSKVRDQGSLNSSPAIAITSLIEYFERRAYGNILEVSPLFLYKIARKLMNWTGDSGSTLRSTFMALNRYGVPEENIWPYNIENFDLEPTSFCYASVRYYHPLYFRLDVGGIPKDLLLHSIKRCVSNGLQCVFGFSTYGSISQSWADGKIPFPCENELMDSGHALMTVGYDDHATIQNTLCDRQFKGAILIKNSWGESWGETGFGWIPYEYIMYGLAVDWWSVVKQTWMDTGQFGE